MNRLVALAAMALLAGCYTLVPVQGEPTIGTDVRAVMTDAEAVRIGGQTGDLEREVEGRLVDVMEDSLVISMVTARIPSELSGSRQLRRSLVLSRDGLQELQIRRISTLRTMFVAGFTAGAVALAVNQVVTGGSNDDTTDPTDPISTLVPIIRIPIGR